MAYWCVARLQPQREALALQCLEQAGHPTYAPRLRELRVVRGRKIEVRPLLFPGYCFVAIELQWHTARWAIGVAGMIMNTTGPARVPDSVIAEIRSRERGGLIELPKPPKHDEVRIHIGDRVRITHGAMSGLSGLYQGMRAGQRVEVLLALLGRVTLRRENVEAI